MGVKLRHVEKLVDVAVGKPLAWALYAGGVIVVTLARVQSSSCARLRGHFGHRFAFLLLTPHIRLLHGV
jgi:hypothetical protein